MTQIGRLDAVTRTWSLAGSLKGGKRAPGVVFDGEQFIVIGGADYSRTENCVLTGESITCTEQESGLDDYAYYPELLLVDSDYGNDC